MDTPAEDFSLLVRQISIDKLQEEPKKLGPNIKAPLVQKNQNESLYSIFIKDLLQPKEGQALKGLLEPFPIKKQQILDLISEVQQVLSAQPILLKQNFKPPVKIFGNIHGDYHDLMRFFDIWKAPCESGDIAGYDYLFLGNYVDRGPQSLEVLCLLLALKLKYPKQIFLLRGNHEDRKVNRYLGFGLECTKRLQENIEDPNSVFQKMNDLFEWLPLGAVIQDKSTNHRVFCVHGGFGSTIVKLEDIEKINRPFKINLGGINEQVQQMAMDLLWSDPTTSEEMVGMHPNTVRDPTKQNNIMYYGPDQVDKFLKVNQLSMIVRSHQNVMDGIDHFASRQLITVTSCCNYGGFENDACFLVVQKKLVISPKIIKPSKAGTPWLAIEAIPDAADPSVKRPPTPTKKKEKD